jgi:adenylate cyclase
MDGLRRHWSRILISLALASPFIMNAAGMLDWGVLRTLEYFAYDARLRLTLPRTVDPRIVIVDVDEKSLAAEGRWPWPRDRMAKLVDLLFRHYGIAVLGFDMVFAEGEHHTAVDELEKVLRASGQETTADRIASLMPRTDEEFAASLAGRPAVLGYYFSGNSNTVGELPEPYLPSVIAEPMRVPAPQATGYGANLPVLEEAAGHAGFFDNPLSDEDGVFRRAPMLQSYRGDLYESLSLAVAELYLGQPLAIGDNNEWLYVGDHGIPVDGKMAALVPYRGEQGSFPYVSASDVLSLSVKHPGVLKGAIVLIGTTAPGLYDLRSTPVQKVYAGVEVHANLISGILDGRFLHRPAYTAGGELLALSLLAVVLAVALPMLGAVWGSVLAVGSLALAVGINLYLWVDYSLVLTVAPVVLMIFSLFLFNVAYGFITESRSRRALARRFGQYVPPELVEEMSDDPDEYSMKGERREMSVLFSDVRGFSNLAENMDPKQLSELMNELLTVLTRVIHDHRGTIDKYMGDAVMAFWGAPLSDARHASGAVMAALKMVRAVAEVTEEFRRRGWPEIRMGIGINSGPMNVGDMGSEFRMAYTVMGDAVNLGSRLEGLTRVYGVDVIVSEYTVRAAPEFVYRLLDRVRVKGRDTPLDVYEPLGMESDLSEEVRSELEAYNRGLALYRDRQWEEARAEFEALLKRVGDNELYQMYMARIQHFTTEPPPPAWDGVFDLKTK